MRRINSCWELIPFHGIFTGFFFGPVLALLLVTPTFAYDLPQVNLGTTSFVDGGPPGGRAGFYLFQYVQHVSADELKDKDGRDLPISNPNLDVTLLLTQFIWISEYKFLGGKAGATILFPYVFPNIDVGGGNFPAAGNNGFGDITFSPLIQWGPYMNNGRPWFIHRLNLAVRFPTGKYSSETEINAGQNSWAFNPYWAATWFATEKLAFSTRLHYLWVAEHDDPNRSLGPLAKDVQPGQAVHMNFASSYEILTKKLRIGVAGYYLKQLTHTEVNGDDVRGRKERVVGIGPGLLYILNRDNALFFNSYFEMAAENRPEGERFVLRWAHRF